MLRQGSWLCQTKAVTKLPSFRGMFPGGPQHRMSSLKTSGGEFHGCYPHQVPMIEGSLEVKLPTIWTDEKQSRAEAQRRERLEERRVEEKE